MPLNNYYINAATFALATSIYTDQSLTTFAPNGYYSDGTIVRQLIGGILLAPQECGDCGVPCGNTISAGGGQGVYNLAIDTGTLESNVGAIIVRFDPANIPDGIFAIYSSTVYNALSSPIYGFLQSTNGNATYIGSTAAVGTCGGWYPSGGTVNNVNVYEYDGSAFIDTGVDQNVTVNTGQIELTATGPGECVMVIPKINNYPNILYLTAIGLCSSTSWSISVECPQELPSFNSTNVDSIVPVNTTCTAPKNNVYYFAKVHTANDTYVGLYDWVFSDPNGENVLADGWYSIDNTYPGQNSIEVQNGVVINIIDKCL